MRTIKNRLVEPDQRGRVALKALLGERVPDRYLASVSSTGVITLTPARVVPEAPEDGVMAAIERTVAEPSTRVRGGRPERKP